MPMGGPYGRGLYEAFASFLPERRLFVSHSVNSLTQSATHIRRLLRPNKLCFGLSRGASLRQPRPSISPAASRAAGFFLEPPDSIPYHRVNDALERHRHVAGIADQDRVMA